MVWNLLGTENDGVAYMDNIMTNIRTNDNHKGQIFGCSGVIPPSLLEETRVPSVYIDALQFCGARNSWAKPSVPHVYNLIASSGLPSHVLSYIWAAINPTSKTGHMERRDFFATLALIALAQKGLSIGDLSRMDRLPIPMLQFSAGVSSRASTSFEARPKPAKVPVIFPGPPPAATHIVRQQIDLAPRQGFIPSLFGILSMKEVEGSSHSTNHSQSCSLQSRERITQAAIRLFESAKTYHDFRSNGFASWEEVSQTDKGSQYLLSLSQVAMILYRVRHEFDGNTAVEEAIQDCLSFWSKLEPYAPSSATKLSDEALRIESINSAGTCGICGGPASDMTRAWPSDTIYHFACANLWNMSVRAELPR